MVTEADQPEDKPPEGIDTSPSTSRPTRVLWMHQQHAADYVGIIVEMGMSLPMGVGPVDATHHRGIPLFLSLISSHAILNLTSGPSVHCHSFIHHCSLSSFRPSRKSHLANHICCIAELLHADAMQQIEVALLGSPAAKLLDILSTSMQSKPSVQHQAAPL